MKKDRGREEKIFCLLFVSFFLLLAANNPLSFAGLAEETKKMAQDYRQKGLEAQKNGQLDKALIYFQKAVQLDPALAITYNDAGVIYEAKGETEKAKESYGHALALDPTLPSPYYNLGSIYEKEGDFETAISYFKKRVLLGELGDGWTDKAKAELRGLGVQDKQARRDYLTQELEEFKAFDGTKAKPHGNDLDPKTRKRDARVHYTLGKKLYYRGLHSEALKELGVAEILDPKNKEIEKLLEEVHRKSLVKE